MTQEILLGAEAVALGAVHAGLSSAYSYPGTPASEVLEYLIRASDGGKAFLARWSVNEKVAYEEALGASFAGKRALVSFKHVGLNVAADPFMNSALTGANGGLVVVSADDPGMHSSQNEQDSRYYAEFAKIPCFEPADHQEAYDMTREAFEVSERFGLPVMVRLVTRLSHSRSSVSTRAARPQNKLHFGRPQDWTLLPANARVRFKKLLASQPEIAGYAATAAWNELRLRDGGRKLGVIVSGIAANYFHEAAAGLAEVPSFLKVGVYPLPEPLVRRLVDDVEAVLVIEEGYPFIEKSLQGLFGLCGKPLHGKLDGAVPPSGELEPDLVRSALGLGAGAAGGATGFPLPGRPPQLCAGCPHGDTLKALTESLEGFAKTNVFSDIGCYTLGALPPYNAVQTCVCMGASVSMAKGGAEAGVYPAVAVIGDSTFAHSGITPLLSAAAVNTDMTVIILDNGTVAMTGGQPSFGTGQGLLRLVEGLGVAKEHLRTIEPLPKNHGRNVEILREEISYHGLSVVVAVRECLVEGRKKRS